MHMRSAAASFRMRNERFAPHFCGAAISYKNKSPTMGGVNASLLANEKYSSLFSTATDEEKVAYEAKIAEAVAAGKTAEEAADAIITEKAAAGKVGYVVGFVDFKDMKAFKEEYSPIAEPTLEPYGGKFAFKHFLPPPLAEKMGMKVSKGFGKTGDLAFALQFPSFDKAMGWFTGPEYAAVISKRDEVSDFRMAVCEGALMVPGSGLVLGFMDFKGM